MKERKQKNILKFLLLIIIFMITYLIIMNTYSKYITAEESSTKSNISKWHILLNNKDISENKDFSENLLLDLDQNENISKNIIAPTSKGHVNLTLESTGTELPFEYEIKIADIENDYSLIYNRFSER